MKGEEGARAMIAANPTSPYHYTTSEAEGGAESAQAKTEGRILRALLYLWAPGDVHELRILASGGRVLSGYYDSPVPLARDAARWDGRANIYWSLNACKPALLERASNTLRSYTPRGQATSDKDILVRRMLLVDIDPVRANGQQKSSTTHGEHLEALAMQGRIADSDFMASLGFCRPIEMDSGNGAYLLYPLNLPNDSTSENMLQCCLRALARKFDCPGAKVDTSTFNASRILRVPGTRNCKGTPTEERPHRRVFLTIFPGVAL